MPHSDVKMKPRHYPKIELLVPDYNYLEIAWLISTKSIFTHPPSLCKVPTMTLFWQILKSKL